MSYDVSRVRFLLDGEPNRENETERDLPWKLTVGSFLESVSSNGRFQNFLLYNIHISTDYKPFPKWH